MWQNTYKNKRVLITGHTGFKGGWLALWLHKLGAEVCGYALPPNTPPNLFEAAQIGSVITSVLGDLSDRDKLNQTFRNFQPEIVFHLAAQPLVRLSYAEPVQTYQTNVMGTLYVLEAARQVSSVKAFVNVTTDKCYENKEVRRGYKEEDPMGGYDMYSSSKGCVEILSSSYRRSFLQNGGYALATARAGNVIGGGDWAVDRLVPDCMRSLQAGKPIEIRSPKSTRPWQHVLEPISGYPLLGHLLYTYGPKYAQAFNFGPDDTSVLTVEDVVRQVIAAYGTGTLQVHPQDQLHEAKLLMLDITKAKQVLRWNPVYTVQQAIGETVSWYKYFYEGQLMREFTMAQIEEYARRISWKAN